jgi:hypothetical protein
MKRQVAFEPLPVSVLFVLVLVVGLWIHSAVSSVSMVGG